jgi:hypothetical protein
MTNEQRAELAIITRASVKLTHAEGCEAEKAILALKNKMGVRGISVSLNLIRLEGKTIGSNVSVYLTDPRSGNLTSHQLEAAPTECQLVKIFADMAKAMKAKVSAQRAEQRAICQDAK